MFYQYRDKRVHLNTITAVGMYLFVLSVPAAAQIFSDAQGWGYPPYYETIQAADIDGDGADELLGRGGIGIVTYDFNAGGIGTDLDFDFLVVELSLAQLLAKDLPGGGLFAVA